jgi:hypothetical protein
MHGRGRPVPVLRVTIDGSSPSELLMAPGLVWGGREGLG